jgi:hypothetical protein
MVFNLHSIQDERVCSTYLEREQKKVGTQLKLYEQATFELILEEKCGPINISSLANTTEFAIF